MKAITKPITESTSYQAILQAMKHRGFIAVSGLSDTAFSCVSFCIGKASRYRLILTYGE